MIVVGLKIAAVALSRSVANEDVVIPGIGGWEVMSDGCDVTSDGREVTRAGWVVMKGTVVDGGVCAESVPLTTWLLEAEAAVPVAFCGGVARVDITGTDVAV